MRQVLPAHAKVSDDAKEAVQKLVSYYINRITKIANERSQMEQRQTVTAENILWAMNQVGLTSYVEPLTRYLQKYREQNIARFLRTRGPNIVRSNVELALGPPTPSAPILPINSAPMPSYAYRAGLFYDPAAAAMMSGFNMNLRSKEMENDDNGPTESSSSTATNYGLPGVNDPYGQFKQ
ncbi:hypothetical protein HAX54_008272 [Datura stramonium]|uniref:Transcription factor CBF/NF-Y/archaeal histone domain-containing protein n=1 Tax=Datura stramonium TaxID=4076 RepID=A0ABS8WZS9_DATST|nr:hypothetical protein [Datura stramonium]